MAFEIYRTNRSISGQAADVPARYDVRTGGQAVGQAISGAGSVLMSLGEKWDLEQADTQFTKAKAQAREEHNRRMILFETADPDDFNKIYEDSSTRMQAFAPKNRRGAKAYNVWLT